MPVIFGKCTKGMNNLNVFNRRFTTIHHEANCSGYYAHLLFSIFCVFLFSENNTIHHEANCSGYYAHLLFSIFCVILFSENNWYLEHTVFVLDKFPFAFLSGLTYISQANPVNLHYNSSLYCSNHVFNKRTQYRKNNGLKCLRSRINTKVDFLRSGGGGGGGGGGCLFEKETPTSQKFGL